MSWLSRYGRYWRSSRRHFKRWFISRRDGAVRPSDGPSDWPNGRPPPTATHPVHHITLCLLAHLPFPFHASFLPAPRRAGRFHRRPTTRPVRVVHFRLLGFAASLSGNRQYGGRAGTVWPNETLLQRTTSPLSMKHKAVYCSHRRCLSIMNPFAESRRIEKTTRRTNGRRRLALSRRLLSRISGNCKLSSSLCIVRTCDGMLSL